MPKRGFLSLALLAILGWAVWTGVSLAQGGAEGGGPSQWRTVDGKPWQGVLRPTGEVKAVHAAYQRAIPFFQALPVAEGKLYPPRPGGFSYGVRAADGTLIPAVVSPAALWPDGSVRWLAVDGVWPRDLPFQGPEGEVVLVEPAGSCPCPPPKDAPVVASLAVRDGEIRLLAPAGETVLTLTPYASYVEIAEPKAILPDSVPDVDRQYEWAQPLAKLNAQGAPKSLSLRVREYGVEQENELYTLYRVRGDGGAGSPGEELEWQLRVRIYRHAPVVRLQMTWALHWEPDRFALTGAEWMARFAAPFTTGFHVLAGGAFDLATGELSIAADPQGRSVLQRSGEPVAAAEWPQPDLGVAVAVAGDRAVGIGVPNAARLGPNRVTIDRHAITFASWDARAGYGLDLRPTTEPGEFGLDPVDFRSRAVGAARTLEAALVWGATLEEVHAVSLLEARRDTLWLPAREELVATQAAGPWAEYAFRNNQEYFEDLSAHLHFLIASRDHWRWNGWINFGDTRTNFSRESDPERGLHPGRWALYGRYGWRNGSAEPYHGMWLAGLALGDRDVAMAALEYALHVVDVDVTHGRFFGEWSPEAGGMHRRNKDHWSGSVQMQYTPSAGLYLIQWLTGHERIKETLVEVRAYATTQGRSGSAFAASAWIHRYMETHDPQDLARARSLLDESAAVWERAGTPREEHLWGEPGAGAHLTGLSALYKNNFRLPLDGIPVLIEFYEATKDPLYLETIATAVQAHGIPAGVDRALSNYLGAAYVLARGYPQERLGSELVSRAREHVTGLVSQVRPLDRRLWNYETLVHLVGGLESASIGWRAKFAPVVLRMFGNPPILIEARSPRNGATVRGVLPIQLDVRDPAQAGDLAQIVIELDGGVIYSGATLPGPDEIRIDTKTLRDGWHTLSWTAVHADYGASRQSIRFNVANTWRLVQNMSPPSSGGWFGVTDFLQTKERSEGWTYDTGDGVRFYGDPQRLVRASDTTEYLVWETPLLKSIEVVLYLRSGTEVGEGIELAVSPDGHTWRAVVYHPEVERSQSDWDRVRIDLEFGDQRAYGWFRLTIFETLPKESVQIGAVVLTGWRE